MASSARIDELRKKFEENPRRYFAPLANEYRKAGDIEQAISICKEYLPQQPGHMSGHIVYGQALYEARQYEEARTVFETALALDPENLIALRHLGDIALIVGDIDGARTWYGRVLEADPRNEEIQAQLKSLESVAPAAAPTPMSTPTVERTATAAAASPAAAPASAAAPAPSPEAAPLPSLELTMPSEVPEAPPASASVQSLSTAPTAEITLDQVPVPAVPDLEKAAEAPRADLPVEKAAGFEPTASASGSEPSGEQTAGLDTTAPAAAEPPPIDSFTLDGLETTSMAPSPTPAEAPPSAVAETPPVVETPPVAEAQPAADAPSPPAVDVPAPIAAEAPTMPPQPEPAAESTPTPLPELEVAPPPVAEVSPAAREPAGSAEPPAPSSELTFLDVGEAMPAPPEQATEPAMAESKPFVTETMAELYEQQGHRDEALRVYRALLDQRPNDDHIRSRIEQLEGKRGPTIRELLSRVASRRPARAPATQPPAAASAEAPPAPGDSTPAVVPAAAPAATALTAEPVVAAALPSAETPAVPVAAPQPTAAPSVSARPRNDVLGQLFGSAPVGGADENAAVTLSAAFSNDGRANGSGSSSVHLPGTPARPASKDLSLDAVFGTENAAPPPASSFSFDQFFSERATAEQPAPGARTAAEGQETKDDTAKFTQWLEGLKQR